MMPLIIDEVVEVFMVTAILSQVAILGNSLSHIVVD
jgi:hypothetical protein